uniref:Uncharacterized protein n=1 Tax=Meloidogyne hapla TaxID=6305 RepID=A0A1I8BWR4_MELHA
MPSSKNINVGGKTNKNNQNCGSSSSDEAEHIGETCSGGWPSTVSVLETPDRRRVRSSLRSNNKNSRTRSMTLIPEVSLPSISTHLSFASSSTIMAIANSPPNCRLSNSFCSPTLRTPRQSLTASIHLSGSPLRSFFIKERRQTSPSCSSLSSTTSYNNRDPVLRPLNLQNYIGVRFSGDISEQTQNQQKLCLLQSSSNLQQENEINKNKEDKKQQNIQQQRRVSKDSGFSEIHSSNDQSSRLSLLTQSSSFIETPSKGLVQIRSLKFERKILSLKWRRESPRKKANNNSLLEWKKIERINIPTNIFIEGINNEKEEEISVLFSSNDCQLMFGKTTDQLEITEKAKNLLKIFSPSKINFTKKSTKSAGLISQLKEEKRIKI